MTAMMRWADGVILVAEPPVMSVCSESGVVVGSGFGVAALPLPHHRWLEKPFQEDVRWDRAALSADAGKGICRLVTFSSHMVKLEPLKPSRHFYDCVTIRCHLRIFSVEISIYLRYCKV